MSCQDAKKLMHDYLDEEISSSDQATLKQHLKECPACKEYFNRMEKSLLLMKSHSHVLAPDDFTDKIMQQIPVEKPTGKLLRFVKGHPFLVAAAVFLLLMGGSLSQIWKDGQGQFSVSAPAMEQIVVNMDERSVIVPEDVVVNGNLIVRNGNVNVLGEVTGDVIVADGQLYMASTANIIGQSEEIDQFFKWSFYHIQRWFKEAVLFNTSN
ncbi:zf-HC2 domain-containing protein [Bacillus horti]|uniref:Anti-sigma factor RsiW n=1 Tax=Caldalkalibacillus horti TaxID=77523 RepID=A0ABT9VYS0_9BACI|nr:zf-HC2 domain-containing protein [Bacillus horti]MDQ0166122.1 anti-sigma factor RsiW [Bacillus horti]